jgi:hypothetical protein
MYQVTVTDKSAVMEILENNGDISRAWDSIRENIKGLAQESLGHCESKHHETWFDGSVQNWLMEGSRLNYSGCRTQVK